MIGQVDAIEEMQGIVSTNQYMDDASSQHTCGKARNRKQNSNMLDMIMECNNENATHRKPKHVETEAQLNIWKMYQVSTRTEM